LGRLMALLSQRPIHAYALRSVVAAYFFFFFFLGQGDFDTFVLEPEFVWFERDPPAPFEFTVKNESSCDRRDFFCLSVRTLHFETNNAGSRLDISMPL
jgi:hypothetical protein